MAGQRRWEVSFQASDPTGDRLREHAERSEGDKDCARGSWCASGTRDQDGGERQPARTYRAFCGKDESIIGSALAAFPAIYARLAAAIGDHVTGEVLCRSPFGPGVPLRCDVDELQRLIIDCAMAWHERVARIARLALPDTQAWRRRSLGPYAGRLLGSSVPVLAAHLVTLLGLEDEPMVRPCSSAVTRSAQVLSNGGDTALVLAGGASAGMEVLALDYMSRSAMLETPAVPDLLLGVPCRECERFALRRAAPAQHDGDPDWYSYCAFCRDVMDIADYRAWTARNARFYASRVTPAMAAS